MKEILLFLSIFFAIRGLIYSISIRVKGYSDSKLYNLTISCGVAYCIDFIYHYINGSFNWRMEGE